MTKVYLLTRSEASVPTGEDWLTEEERATLAGFRFPKRRAEWRLGRWTARQALAAALEVPFAEVAVRAAPDGAPEALLHGAPAPVALSLSHRDGVAACALAPHPVALGCDLERIEPRTPAFVADYFTPSERAIMARTPSRAHARTANLIWSAKECALKALRTGLRLDTRAVEVAFPEAPSVHGWRPFTVAYVGEDRRFDGWWRQAGAHLLTVAADPPPAPPVQLRPNAA